MAKRMLVMAVAGLMGLFLSLVGVALDLAEVPEEIRAELLSTADMMADGKLLIVGRLHFSDDRVIEGGGCPEAFVNYVQTIDEPLKVEAGGWFYTWQSIESFYADGGVLQIRALGHRPVDIPLTVDADIVLIDDIELVPETDYEIEGTVHDAAGEPVPNIVIDLHFPVASDCWEPIATVRTDDAGSYSFQGLSSAEHRVILGVPFGFLYVTTDITPKSTEEAEIVDFVLYSELQIVIDYVYQPNGTRALTGSGVITGTVMWATTHGFDFDDGEPEHFEQDDLRDLELIQDGGELFFRVFYTSEEENGFYQVSDTGFVDVVEAAESGYQIRQTLCNVGDVFVVRTYEGHYAKLVVQAIEEMPH